jgi:hypothetical protein
MSNYNEALDSEKRTLSLLVETSFYPQTASAPPSNEDMETILRMLQHDPELSKRLMQVLRSGAVASGQGEHSPH